MCGFYLKSLQQGPEKAHKHLAHKQVLSHPSHRSSRPGTQSSRPGTRTKNFQNVYVPWIPHTAHKLFTPGHRSGDPWPPGRETPPTRAVTRKICLCLCAFSFPDSRASDYILIVPKCQPRIHCACFTHVHPPLPHGAISHSGCLLQAGFAHSGILFRLSFA